MPKGLPSAALLMEEKITFFSLDTDIIQSEGYKFDVGALHKMALQRPPWMRIHLTEVVEREVKTHRMLPIVEAAQQLSSASSKLARAELDMSSINEAIATLSIEQSANSLFDEQFKRFVERLGGSVLPIEGASLAKEIFRRYFDTKPPFGNKKDKKSEFPDAAALLALENYAKINGTLGILISKDAGWASFANSSESLFCVNSLDSFTALFASEGANAETVKKQVRESLDDSTSSLALELESVLGDHIAEASWVVDDLYSGGSERLEGEVCDSRLISYEIDSSRINVWFVEHDPSRCLVEFTASVKADVCVNIGVFVWDSIDREELSIGSTDVTVSVDQNVDVFLTYHGRLLHQPPSEWEVEIEIADGDYSVDVGEIDLDFSDPD